MSLVIGTNVLRLFVYLQNANNIFIIFFDSPQENDVAVNDLVLYTTVAAKVTDQF